jgi:hypothetical protein
VTPSFDTFEQAVHDHFRFEECGFDAPAREEIGQRYRHVAYERPNLALEFAIEAPEFLPWWTAVRLIEGQHPSSYAVDELGRTRRLYSYQITRAIRPHIQGWAAAEAGCLRCYARYFLEHSDSVFEQIDREKREPPKRKLP